MNKGASLSPLALRRRLGFLRTFERKFESLERERERLVKAAGVGEARLGGWPTEGIERIARSLSGAGAVYGLEGLTAWAKGVLARIEVIRVCPDPPSSDELDWLGTQINDLHKLHSEASTEAEKLLDSYGGHVSKLPRERASFSAPPRPNSFSPESIPAEPPLGSMPPADATPSTMRATVLVAAATASTRKQVAYTLTGAGYEVFEAETTTEVIKAIEKAAPDLIIIEEDGRLATDEVPIRKQIARDPLVDLVPVIVIKENREPDSDRVLFKPFNPEELVTKARRLTGPANDLTPVSAQLHQTSLNELVNFVANELRFGVLDAATGPGAQHRFSVRHEGPLVASIWTLIGQLRRIASVELGDRIDFSPVSHGWIDMMAPANVSASTLTPSKQIPQADLDALQGIEVLVAGEDPEIRAVFRKVLGQLGMVVRAADDGDRALRSMQLTPPALVIADIALPGRDGWDLSNRLAKEFGLNHIPVILLSWKEDFLHRLRAQQVRDDTFQVSERDRAQIIQRVARVLKPRLHLERQLKTAGAATGRVERLGAISILEMALKTGDDLHLTFRDSYNLFELELRHGDLASVTRTGQDRSYSTGSVALQNLICMQRGRFKVHGPEGTAEQQFPEGTHGAISAALTNLNKLVYQVVDRAYTNIDRLEMNWDTIGLLTQHMPSPTRQAMIRLKNEGAPRHIQKELRLPEEAMERLLLDLIRHGAVRKIFSRHGAESAGGVFSNRPNSPPSIATLPPPSKQDRTSIPPPAPGVARRSLSIPPPAPVPEGRSMSVPPPAPGSKGRDRSEVFYLSTTDIQEIEQTEEEAARYRSRRSKNRGISIAVTLSLILVGALGYFLFQTRANGMLPNSEPAPQKSVEPPTPPAEKPVHPPTDTATPVPGTAAAPTAPVDSAAVTPASAGPSARIPDAQKPTATKSKTPAAAPAPTPKQTKSRKRATSKSSTAKSDTKEQGVLYIKAPRHTSRKVEVSVDGKPRGNAPIKLRLEPGLHEVVYMRKGRRKLKMVTVAAGSTKTIRAVVP